MEDKIHKIVYEAETKNKDGFTDAEILRLIQRIGGTFSVDKYNSAMLGNTCSMDGDGNIINDHCDVYHALLCGYENRDLTIEEWD